MIQAWQRQFAEVRGNPGLEIADPNPERLATGRGVRFVQNQDFAIAIVWTCRVMVSTRHQQIRASTNKQDGKLTKKSTGYSISFGVKV
jgi:hypothetical protein